MLVRLTGGVVDEAVDELVPELDDDPLEPDEPLELLDEELDDPVVDVASGSTGGGGVKAIDRTSVEI